MVALPQGTAGAEVPPAEFLTPERSLSGGNWAENLTTADFNGDGNTDAAVGNIGIDLWSPGVAVLFGDGAGNLSGPVVTDLPEEAGPFELATADFDEDGDQDLAGLLFDDGYVIVTLLGNGDGTFDVQPFRLPAEEGQLATADFDGDGHQDLAHGTVFSFLEGTEMRIFRGKGDGTFFPPTVQELEVDANEMFAADYEGDGDVDLVGTGGSAWTLLNGGDGSFAPQVWTFSNQLVGSDAGVADFNGDGIVDIGLVNQAGGDISAGLGRPDGRFPAGSAVPGRGHAAAVHHRSRFHRRRPS